MLLLTPGAHPVLAGGFQYTVDWTHPLTNGLNYVNVTNNLMGAPTYSRYGAGTYSNVGCSVSCLDRGVGISGTASTSKLKWTGAGPKLNQTAGTVLAYVTVGTTGGNRFLFRLDNGAETLSLLYFFPNNTSINYGWFNGGTTYKNAAIGTGNNQSVVTGFTWTNAPNQTLWYNYVKSTDTTAFTSSDTTSWNLNIANSDSTNLSFLDNANARVYWIAFWDRVLSDSEIVHVTQHPMTFLQPIGEQEMPVAFLPPVVTSFPFFNMPQMGI